MKFTIETDQDLQTAKKAYRNRLLYTMTFILATITPFGNDNVPKDFKPKDFKYNFITLRYEN